jgi:hypothetical protein
MLLMLAVSWGMTRRPAASEVGRGGVWCWVGVLAAESVLVCAGYDSFQRMVWQI